MAHQRGIRFIVEQPLTSVGPSVSYHASQNWGLADCIMRCLGYVCLETHSRFPDLCWRQDWSQDKAVCLPCLHMSMVQNKSMPQVTI